MMKFLYRFLTSFGLILTFAVASPIAVNAFDAFGAACSDGGGASAVCKDQSGADPITGSNGIVMKIVNLLAILTGAIAFIIIIIAGFNLVTSGGGKDAVAGARTSIINAAIGLVIIVLARQIIAFVVSKI